MQLPWHPSPRLCARHRGFAGSFGGRFADDGELGGRGFGMGRKLASADLQVLILRLLADKPHHGYEIIKALDERSSGFYAPSPGMVYPALAHLVDAGHATPEADGHRKRYHITDGGRRHLAAHAELAEALLARFERVGERMEHLRHAMQRSGAGSGPRGRLSAGETVRRAEQALLRVLRDRRGCPPEEEGRIAAILREAATRIAPPKAT